MGKVDQGVVTLWVACHVFKKPLRYIGFGGTGKQVRDVLHIDDLCRGALFNVGGGRAVSVSLAELTTLCRSVTGHTIPIGTIPENRAADVPLYVTDNSAIEERLGWRPRRPTEQVIEDVHAWIKAHARALEPILAG
jgi:CDP-paratose 2-epimerase